MLTKLDLLQAIVAVAVVALSGPSLDEEMKPWASVHQAVAVVHATEGHDVAGTVRFLDVPGGVRVVADITGLDPGARHAIHIHEFGDFTAADATSAGGHYDPLDTGHHARPNAEEPHHAGDMGNLDADSTGRARYDHVIKGITVAGTRSPIVGRGVIIHAGADHFDQPTGSAGGRIGFGCIGVAKPASFAIANDEADPLP